MVAMDDCLRQMMVNRLSTTSNDGLRAVIPEPDYSDSEEEENRQGRANCGPPRPPISADGLILPRKLTNPCQESADRRQLHRELTFNQKTGRSVLAQKSELQRAMERHREQQERRQLDLQQLASRTSFELTMQERLLRAQPKTLEDGDAKIEAASTPEFLKVHAKVRANINIPS